MDMFFKNVNIFEIAKHYEFQKYLNCDFLEKWTKFGNCEFFSKTWTKNLEMWTILKSANIFWKLRTISKIVNKNWNFEHFSKRGKKENKDKKWKQIG